MEIVNTIISLLILVELTIILLALIRLGEEDTEQSKEEKKTRRDVEGIFANPLGDSYRKNKGLYVPVKPGSVMLDGDEEDEV